MRHSIVFSLHCSDIDQLWNKNFLIICSSHSAIDDVVMKASVDMFDLSWGLVKQFYPFIISNIGWSNDLLQSGTKPLPEPMLTLYGISRFQKGKS